MKYIFACHFLLIFNFDSQCKNIISTPKMTCKDFFPLVLEGKIERNTNTYAQVCF